MTTEEQSVVLLERPRRARGFFFGEEFHMPGGFLAA
jgi:hypothetical protein